MSIDAIEKYLQEMDAIKNYPQVKRENEELARRLEELEVSLDNVLKENSSLKSSKAKLDGAEMTLEEARLDYIRAQDAEVEKRAADRLEKLKAEYESKLPELVYQKLRDILGQSVWPEEIAKLIDTEAKKKADVILQHPKSWPPWFKELYHEEVAKKVSAELNEEFDARVEAAAETRARQRLKELITTHWPGWHREHVEPRIAELENKIRAGALQSLTGPWMFTCDRCGTTANDELTASDIEQLLKTGQIKVTCANRECEDQSLFSTRRHTFQVFLYDLIDDYISTIVVSKK